MLFCHKHYLFLLQLEIKKSKNEAECEGLRAQIRELWDRLQIPEEEREPVAAIMTGSKAKVRNAVRKPMGAGKIVFSEHFWVQSNVLPTVLGQ